MRWELVGVWPEAENRATRRQTVPEGSDGGRSNGKKLWTRSPFDVSTPTPDSAASRPSADNRCRPKRPSRFNEPFFTSESKIRFTLKPLRRPRENDNSFFSRIHTACADGARVGRYGCIRYFTVNSCRFAVGAATASFPITAHAVYAHIRTRSCRVVIA